MANRPDILGNSCNNNNASNKLLLLLDKLDDEVDQRYVIAPAGTELSTESVNHLLSVDNKFSFRGNLRRLPNILKL